MIFMIALKLRMPRICVLVPLDIVRPCKRALYFSLIVHDVIFHQLLASVPVFWLQLLTGSIEGHSAVLLPQLEESEKFQISLEEESWIGENIYKCY